MAESTTPPAIPTTPGSSQIEVDSTDEERLDGDSVYSSGFDSDTTSLLTVARNYVFENGRRFHGYKEGRYMVPNDEAEQDRLDLCHHYLLLALKGVLYTAPLKELRPHRILDVGCGTGIWCIDIGDEFPAAEVRGVDLSPIQPDWVPPNVVFEVDDIEEPWLWPDNHFDYIHARAMACFLDDWPKLIRQAYRALKPGGYFEIQDITDFFHCDDESVPKDSFLTRWIETTEFATKKLGRPWLEVDKMVIDLLKKEGYEDINEQSIKCPIGVWAKDKGLKELGMFARQMKWDGVEAFILGMFTKVLGWPLDEVQMFLEGVRRDLVNPKYHPWERFYCIYGKKPEND